MPASKRQDDLDEHREKSDRLQILNGNWKFRYYNSIFDVTDLFYEEGYDISGFDELMVPGVWQTAGYDIPQYTNIRYPFPFAPPYVPHDIPCGAYVHTLFYQKEEKAPKAFLNFEGVDSCFYLWLNGKYVGYSQVSHMTSEFDVTDFLKEGENNISVLVLKWCDGSYMEDQDKFRMSGIFRDVYILKRPESAVWDYCITTDISEDLAKAKIQSVTVMFVDYCGGDAAAWRLVAIIYAVIGLIVNTISGLSVKELPEEELDETQAKEEKYGLAEAFKLIIANKYYIMICGVYILQQLYGAMIGAGIFYATWVLKNKNLFGVFSWAVNIPLIIALIFTPTLVGKWKGMYKLNLRGYMLAVLGRGLVVVAGYMGSVPLMLLFTALAAFGQGPWQGDMNAVIASCSEYTYLTKGKKVDGTMYSCTSLGVKLGGGIGTAVVGWLLEFSGYVGTAASQPQSCINMLQFMYLWLPLIFNVLIMIILSKMNVEEANAKIRAEKGITSASTNVKQK